MEKLVKQLSVIPLEKLVSFLGGDVVAGLQKYNVAKNEKEIAKILIELKGTDLFRTKDLLKALIWTFSEQDLAFIKKYTRADPQISNDDYRISVRNKKWVRNDFCKAILILLNVEDDEYFETLSYNTVDTELVVPRISLRDNFFGDYKIFIPETYPLHPYQKSTKDEIVNILFTPGTRFVLHMPTGSGKTKTAIEAMVDFWRAKGRSQGFMVWFAHSKELCEQAYETFKQIWAAKGDYPLQLYKIFDANSHDLSNAESGMVFIGFQKFNHLIRKNSITARKLKDNTRIVVVDEAHKSIAKTYNDSIDYLLSNDTRLIGLTATPGRSSDYTDGENAQLSSFFHGKKVSILNEFGMELDDPIKYLQDNEYLAKLDRIEVETNIVISKNTSQNIQYKDFAISAESIERISTDDIRNSRILEEIENAVKDRNDPTLVFSASKSHALILKILLQKKDINSQCVLGSTPSSLRATYIDSFKSNELPVLINYGVLTTGFDAPNIRTLVVSRPTLSIILYSQMLGRALRGPKMGGGASKNTLVDIVDNYSEFGTERATFNFFDDYFAN